VSSLLDLESKYNRAIEEKTLLEGEVIHRQELEEECQRLKDDVRGAFRACCSRDSAVQMSICPYS
jgi:nuclear distribution protein NudE